MSDFPTTIECVALVIDNCWRVSENGFRRSKDYPECGERQTYIRADLAAERERELVEALEESQKDLIALRGTTRKASRYDHGWQGVPEIIEKRIESNRAILATHEQTDDGRLT